MVADILTMSLDLITKSRACIILNNKQLETFLYARTLKVMFVVFVDSWPHRFNLGRIETHKISKI